MANHRVQSVRRFRAGVATGLLAFITAATCNATVTVTGAYVGPAGSNPAGGENGGPGYSALPDENDYEFDNANCTGGAGAVATQTASTVGTGTGGDGVEATGSGVFGNHGILTFNGGFYTGGAGGGLTNSSTGAFRPADGGSGAYIGEGNVVVNAGLFQGGDGGPGLPQNGNTPGGGGVGLAIFSSSSVSSIYGGLFVGGQGQLPGPGLSMGSPGGTLNIFGGYFDGGDDNQNNSFDILLDAGTLNLYGTDFELNGAPVADGPLYATQGTLTAVLEDNFGTASNTSFLVDGGSINLIAVPEPTMLTCITAGLTGWACRRKRAPQTC